MKTMIKRYFVGPKYESFFMFGPRGTGKSTWLRQYYPDAYIIDLLDHEQYLQYLSHPEHLNAVVAARANDSPQIIIDEIQRVPNLLNSVHSLIEKNDRIQFIMTGSSARKLRHGGVNLLGGRALERKMHPFIAAELGEAFQLNHALQYGLIPLIVQSRDPLNKIKAYISLYLKEEVQSEGLVRHIGDFARFLEVMSFSHGSLLNLSNIAREAKVSRKVCENYLSILKDLLLASTIPCFQKRAQREMVQAEKFYFFDTGIYTHLRPKGPIDRFEEIYGIALEGLVYQHLQAWVDYIMKDVSIYYWRTRGGAEVDFILYGPDCFMAIEVKYAKQVQRKDLSHLKSFCIDYPEATPLLLYMGSESINIEGIACEPVETFLKQSLTN